MASGNRKPILISGAGLSSLLLAQSLRQASVPFLIFEKDRSISFRAQGFRLRMSPEGLDAIESALTPEDFERFWEKCGKTAGASLNSLDAITGETIPNPSIPALLGIRDNGKSLLASRGGVTVGIARGDMRKIFMTGCEPFILWSHQVIGYELTPSGVRATFADGSKSVEGDMLVGGEGIYSPVAKQVSRGRIKVFDLLARGIQGQAPITAFRNLGEGVWRIKDSTDAKGAVTIITNVRSGEDRNNPRIQLGYEMVGEPGVIETPNDDYSILGEPAAEIAKALTANWNPRFQPLFNEMNVPETAFWKITCSTPSGIPEWPNEPRVTVIGDAVHSMTPAGGFGANTAVRDAVLLGRLLAEAGGYKAGVTASYEKEMRAYGSEAVALSYAIATVMYGVKIDEHSPTV